ncbi:MAG: hypothetical protein PUJ57_04925 [Peptoniphilaceae bacterium]|nr:hypothetical protein [Peptoniphilaceae bacterium]
MKAVAPSYKKYAFNRPAFSSTFGEDGIAAAITMEPLFATGIVLQ